MRLAAKALLLSLLIATLGTSAATAANGDCRLIRGADTPTVTTDDVSACRLDTWFHQADTKAGNLAGFGQGAFPSWNTTKPVDSYQSGAGGGYLTNSLPHQATEPYDPRGSAIFEGKYTGTIDNLAVDIYALIPPTYSENLDVQLVVDGQTVYEADETAPKTTAGDTPGVLEYRYAFTNVYSALEGLGIQGDATTVHNVRLAVIGTFIVNDPAIFVYDAAEVPSGVVFNIEPSELTKYGQIDLGGEEG